jgi:hypothetical protein
VDIDAHGSCTSWNYMVDVCVFAPQDEGKGKLDQVSQFWGY